MTLNLLSIVENRSGLIKTKTICDAIQRFNGGTLPVPISHLLVHVSQRSETRGFDLHFNDLELPKPDIFLDVPVGATPFEKTALIAERLAQVLARECPAMVLIAGDGDSLLDCALVTKRMQLYADGGRRLVPALVRVAAGRRSFDRTVLPEVNRVVTDMLSDYLFTTKEQATENLLQEGVSREKIHFVGSIVAATLLNHRAAVADSTILTDLQLVSGTSIRPFALLALRHLPQERGIGRLSQLQMALSEIARHMPIVFPANPSVCKLIQQADLGDYFIDHFLDAPEPRDERVRIRLIPSLGYFDSVRLAAAAKVVLTDSLVVEEESRLLGVPCIVIGEPLRFPSGTRGANEPVGIEPGAVIAAFLKATRIESARRELPPGCDGHAARRIVNLLWDEFRGRANKGFPANTSTLMSFTGR
jgi:UDP-N-acetylglucosamine 2-epimerase (non-hydrolysing)